MALKVVQSSLIRQVKNIGASVGAPELQSNIIKWIQSISENSNQMNDLNVILFDSHSDLIAKELLERNVKNLFLIEGSQINADKQKESVEDLEEKYPNSNISALHASMKDILSPSKSAKINISLWQKFFDLNDKHIKYKNYKGFEKEKNKTVMFGCLPFPTQQRALLQSLLEQLLIYYDSSEEITKKTKSVNSYFQFGSFSLITFLHSSHFTRIISAQIGKPELQFYGLSHRTFSYIFNTLFNVEQISDGIGYDLSNFEPQIPLTPTKTYLKQIEKLGFEENKLYPIKIEPKQFIQIPGNIEIPFKLQKNDESDLIREKRKQILNYAFWILICGKNPNQLIWDTFGLSFTDEISQPRTVSEFASYFSQVSEELDKVFPSELNSFRQSLYKNKSNENVVD